MSHSNTDFPLIQGLSKREQSKFQRLEKSDEADKGNSHSKSYKRKPNRQKPSIDQPQRKLIKTSTTPPDAKSQSGSSHRPSQAFQKSNSAQPSSKKKVDPKQQKVYNPEFLKDQGEDGLFEYIMMYSYTEKQKKLQTPQEDFSDVTKLEGQKLVMEKKSDIEAHQNLFMQKFSSLKNKIQQPFDDTYNQLMKSLSDKIKKKA